MYKLFINDDINNFDLETILPQLSEQRRNKVMAYKHKQGQKLSAAAYMLLKQALKDVYDIDESPTFEYEDGGKPFIANHPHIHFNMSHCAKAAACVVSDNDIGIDIETIRTYRPMLAERVLNSDELAIVESSEHRDIEFIKFWTQKESVLKLTGLGIRCDLKQVLLRDDITINTHIMNDYIYSIATYRD